MGIIVGVEQFGNALPTAFALLQNYPNPFNPATTLRYDLPEAGNVHLEILDLLGRKVAELVNGEQAAGRHAVSWEGTRSSSGIYFARISVTPRDNGRTNGRNFTHMIKMALVK